MTTWENHSIAAASCLDRTPRKVITQRNSCACSYWGNMYKEFNALEKRSSNMNTCVNSRLLFVGICKRPFQKKDWRPQNTLSSHVEFISHKTTLKEVLGYLDVQVYRCVLQIPLCIIFSHLWWPRESLKKHIVSRCWRWQTSEPLELYQHRFHIFVFMHCLLGQFN